MDVRGLGFALGQTPFEDNAPIDFGRRGLTCGTGDQFVTAPPELSTDLVDMEAYALAKSARDHQIEFYCLNIFLTKPMMPRRHHGKTTSKKARRYL